MKTFGMLTLLFTTSLGLLAQGRCPDGPHTLYSKTSVSLDSGLEQIESPDGKKLLTVKRVEDQRDPDGVDLSFTVHASGKEYSTQLLGFNAEVSWSPDSAAFAVTQTEGGGGIGYSTYVFYVGENGLKEIEAAKVIVKAFGTPVKCEIAVPPNIGFVGWLGRSHRILVAAEVVPVSICQCSGMFKLYELNLPDLRILHAYSQNEAKRKFPEFLGCELQHADDKCAEDSQRK